MYLFIGRDSYDNYCVLQVILAVLGMCAAYPFISEDTPEVAAQKVIFFRTFEASKQASAQALARALSRSDKWYGPMASLHPASVPGFMPVTNTADVDTATNAFNAAYQRQLLLTRPAVVG